MAKKKYPWKQSIGKVCTIAHAVNGKCTFMNIGKRKKPSVSIVERPLRAILFSGCAK